MVLGVAWVRVALSAADELAQGQALETRRDRAGALRHYQWALRWYSPLASAPVKAADALDRMAREAVERGDRAEALAALRRLRGGILSTRWLLSPFGDRLPDVNARLAKLTAEQQVAEGHAVTIAGRSQSELEAEHARLLALDPMPAPGWSLLVVLSFLGWIGGGLLTIFRGLDREVRLQRGPALRYGALTAVCFSLWILGLTQA